MSGHNLVLFRSLRADLLGRLNAAIRVAREGDDEAVAKCARSEMGAIAAGFLTFIDEHQPTADGYCSKCCSGRWFRRRPAPCRALLRAHLALVNGPTA